MNEFTYKPLREVLRDGMVRVVFIKKDGSTRVMDCTTNVALVGHLFKESGQDAVQVVEKPDHYRVIDIEAGGFRSFNKDQVISYEYDGNVVVFKNDARDAGESQC